MPPDDIDLACRLHDGAVGARAQGNLEEAESLGRKALRLLEKAEGTAHPDVANVLNHLGSVRADRGDYAEAERLYQRAVRIMEQSSPALESTARVATGGN